jgi:uncharacterized protein (DUF3084 family)
MMDFMDEQLLRRIVREEVQGVREEVQSVREEVQSVREEVQSVREEVQSVREEVRAAEQRLGENGRVLFRQLGDLYRATLEKVEHLEKHLGERIDATRGAIEALRSSLERQDFRSDELGRRITALETRYDR